MNGFDRYLASSPREGVFSHVDNQFTDPLSFLRELVQNAIDAGSLKIEVTCSFEDDLHEAVTCPGGITREQLGTARVCVTDWGEGMDRHTIDTRLTRLFSSDKDRDPTKIGRFGIGFSAVFAMKPDAVCVDTGRFGESWRLVFRPDRTFTRVRLREAIEGTAIHLFKAMEASEYAALEQNVRRALLHDCPHVDVVLRYQGVQINRPLNLDALDASIKAATFEQGAEIVVGFTESGSSDTASYYNRGLMLLVRPSEFPGISYKVNSPRLRSALNRNDVMVDEYYELVLSIVRRVASGQLVNELSQRLDAGLRQGLPEEELVNMQRPLATLLRLRAPLPTVCAARAVARSPHGHLYTLMFCEETVQSHRLFAVSHPSPLSAAVCATGDVVLEDWQADLMIALCQGDAPRLEREFVLPLPIQENAQLRGSSSEALRASTLALLKGIAAPVGAVELGYLDYPGSGASWLPAIVQPLSFGLSRLAAALPARQVWVSGAGRSALQSLAHSVAEGSRHSLDNTLASAAAHPVIPSPPMDSEQVTWVLNVDHPSLRILLPLAVREPELAAYILIKMCLPRGPLPPTLDSDLLTLAMVRHCQRKEAPLTERLITLLTAKGVIDSPGTFTVNPDLARERIRRSRFPNPLGYVLDLVQAAAIKGAKRMSFRFGAGDMLIRFDGEPFAARDFDQLYASILSKEGGPEAEARRLLGMALCKAMQAGIALVQVESGHAFVELRPELPDRHVARKQASPQTQIRLQQRLGLGMLKRYLDHLGGHLTAEVLLQERCVHSRMTIVLDGRIISQGHTLSDDRPWQTYAVERISGAVEVAPLPSLPLEAGPDQMAPELALSPTLLRLIKNGVWVDTQLPIELAPGFRALAESPAYPLDVSCEHVVQGDEYAATLRAVAAAQVELLATQCRAYVQRLLPAASPHSGGSKSVLPDAHLRALLRGLLFRLGGLGPVLRWANLPSQQFPPDTIADDNPGWPAEILDGAALLEVPILPSHNGALVTLRELLRDFVQHQTVAYTTQAHREPDAKRQLVLLVSDLSNEALLRSLFGDALECLDDASRSSPDTGVAMGSWRRPSYRLRLSSQLLIARVPLIGLGVAGEIGVEPHHLNLAPWQRRRGQPSQLRLLFIKDGCLISEKAVPFPVPDLTVVVTGDFTPSYLLGEVISDAQLGLLLDSIYNALPVLIDRMVQYGEQFQARARAATLPSPPQEDQQAWWALVLRRLVILALSVDARKRALLAMGIHEVSTRSLAPNAIRSPDLWRQLQNLPLFQAIDGAALSLSDLSWSAARVGWVAVLCPSLAIHPSRLETWAGCCQTNLVPAEIWDDPRSVGPSGDTPRATSVDRPNFILWLAPEEHALWGELAVQLSPACMVDGEPWLRTQAALTLAATSQSDRLSLPEECQAHVPLLSVEGLPGVAGLEGMLGALVEARFASARESDPRIVISLFRRRCNLGSHEMWIPGGRYLSAVVDHSQLQMSADGLDVAENDGLMQVRVAVASALPRLFAQIVRRPLPWLPLCRAMLFDAVTALFPGPAFRAAYERLQLYGSHATGTEGPDSWLRQPSFIERDYAALLRLAMATSPERTETVLEQHLLQVGPLSVANVTRDVLDAVDNSRPGAVEPADEAAADPRAEPPPGAMAWLRVLYPNSEGLPADERALCLLPVLATAPLLMHCDGSPLSFATLISDFRQHGNILYASNSSPPLLDTAARPVILNAGTHHSEDLLRVLHCLFGAKNVQDTRTLARRDTPPGRQTLAAVSSSRSPNDGLLESDKDVQLLAAVIEELSSFSMNSGRLLDRVRPDWLQLDDSLQQGAVVCLEQRCLINTRHPAVRLAQRHFRTDPQCVRFLALAVYSALCAQGTGLDEEEAGRCYHHLAVRALAASRHPVA